MSWDTGNCNITVQSLGQTRYQFIPLTWGKRGWRRRCEDEVPIQIDNKSITGCGEKTPTFGRESQDIWTRLLYEIFGMAGVYHRNIEPTPLIHSDAEADGLCGSGEHCGVMTNKNDSAGW